MQAAQDIRFRLSPDQEQRFNAFFKDLQEKYLFLLGLDFLATIRRLGLIFFRICMVLTALRIPEKGHPGTKMECDERDFEIARTMIRVLIKHSARVFSELPEEVKPVPRKNKKEEFLEALPEEFSCKVYQEIGKKLGISHKTSYRHIQGFIEKGFVQRCQRDDYKKIRQEDQAMIEPQGQQ